MCMKCENTEMSQRHLLECKHLIGKSKLVSYIPEYNDIFKEDIAQQIYTSRVLRDNHRRLLAQTTMWTGPIYNPCSAMTIVIVLDLQ